MYQWEKIKRLHREGQSIRGLARDMRMSRNTIRKYINSIDPPRFHARDYKSKAASYREHVLKMIKNGYIGTRIRRELIALGFDGSQSCVDRFIKKLKREHNINSAKMTTRFETAPAQQCQYDWKEWTLSIGGHNTKVYIHAVILAFSRKKYYTFSLTNTTNDIKRVLSEAFEYFGGMTKEVLFDNAKQMVITHLKKEVILFNEAFLDFCGLYGITPIAAQNYRAQTKGKVERPFYYIQEHLLRGLSVDDLSEFEEKLMGMSDEMGVLYNHYLSETPNERFRRERAHLIPIPKLDPSKVFKRDIRKISADGYLSWSSKQYPIPMKYVGQSVFVESFLGERFSVYTQKGEIICSYQKRLNGPYQIEHPDHLKMNEAMLSRKKSHRDSARQEFIDVYQDTGETFVRGLQLQTKENMYWHLHEINTFQMLYSHHDILDALKQSIAINVFHKNTLKRLLSKKEMLHPNPNQRHVMHVPAQSIDRPLSVYKGLSHA